MPDQPAHCGFCRKPASTFEWHEDLTLDGRVLTYTVVAHPCGCIYDVDAPRVGHHGGGHDG